MYFIGIDPSTKRTGIAVVTEDQTLVYYQNITLEKKSPENYDTLYQALRIIFDTFTPEAVWIEDQFYQFNADTLKKVARISGIALFAVHGYTDKHDLVPPGKWRKLFHGAGHGNASKRDSFDLVNSLYNNQFESFKDHHDITDAIGIANACTLFYQTTDTSSPE